MLLLRGVDRLALYVSVRGLGQHVCYAGKPALLDVAEGYRSRQLPEDVLVVDFLNMTRQGEMDLDPKRWPDPRAMNDRLHAMGFTTVLSVWPHFSEGT